MGRHYKSVQVCRANPPRYPDCQGCGVLIEDRERYGSRIFSIVESSHPPHFEVLEVVEVEEKKKPNKRSTSEAGAIKQAFDRLTKKGGRNGQKKRKRK
jgi:hypothetical protein